MPNAETLRIIFAGTPQFAVPPLRALHQSRHELCAVYTQPDRPSGRGRKLSASPVKQYAQAIDCPVLQPQSLRDESVLQTLSGFDADVMVVVAYGLILPQSVLTTPRHGCLNIHASLLPRWRGAAPIQRAILAGDRETGVTIMQMDRGLDTGDMLSAVAIPIQDSDTSLTLHDKLAEDGATALLDVLDSLVAGRLAATAQDDTLASYAEKLTKSEARLDWTRSALALDRRVRAYLPWPVAECLLGDQRLRIWSSAVLDHTSSSPPGTVLRSDKTGIDVVTGSGVLRLLQVQLPGGKPVSAAQFAAAHDIANQQLS